MPYRCPECIRQHGPQFRGECDHGLDYATPYNTPSALQFWGVRGFNIADCGGGCEAFRLDLADGRYILVTKAEDSEAPETTDEEVVIGLYDGNADHNEEIDGFHAYGSEEAAETLDQLRAHDPQWAQPNGAQS